MVFNTPGYFRVEGEKSGAFDIIVVGDTPTQPQQQHTYTVYARNNINAYFERSLGWYVTNRSSTTYCRTIAHMAAAFSDSVYDRNLVERSLMNHGFDENNIITLGYGVANQWLAHGSPAFAIARKDVANGERVVAIIIRGSDSLTDWQTNIDALPVHRGGAHVHPGFHMSMREVVASLAMRLGDGWYNNTTFFIAGHSYGGAVTNLLAREIERNYGVSRNRIFAYTFGAPNVARASGMPRLNWNDEYSNIFNIVNNNDFVTTVPAPVFSWGTMILGRPSNYLWYRFGRDVRFTCDPSLRVGLGNRHAMETYLGVVGIWGEPVWDATHVGRFVRANSPIDLTVIDRQNNIVGTIIGGIPWHNEEFFGSVF